jgi:hypothetical protein
MISADQSQDSTGARGASRGMAENEKTTVTTCVLCFLSDLLSDGFFIRIFYSGMFVYRPAEDAASLAPHASFFG